MVDPLEQFRRKKPAATAVGIAEDRADIDDGEYRAFHAVDRRQIRLKIRPTLAPWDRVTYSYLLHMPEDDHGTYLALVFTYLTVVIKGRNLQELAEAIADERCEFIQAYNPAKWSKPKDVSAAYIERIEIQAAARERSESEEEADTEMA